MNAQIRFVQYKNKYRYINQIPWGERELCCYKSQDRSVVTKVNITQFKNGLRSVSV